MQTIIIEQILHNHWEIRLQSRFYIYKRNLKKKTGF
jgi:hypothetical protein